MSFIHLCVLLPCSSHHVILHSHYPCPGKRKARKKPSKGKHGQNSCRSSWVRCQSILHSFSVPYSAIHCCLLQSPSPPPALALHLSFIAFGPQLPLPCFSSPGWANLSCSIPSSLPLLLALPILDMNSLSLREPHRAWHTAVPFQALL